MGDLYNRISVLTIPRTQFRNGNEILTYDEKVYLFQSGNFGKRKLDSIASARRKKDGKHELSDNAKKRLKRAINNLSLLCPQKWKSNPCTGGMQTHECSMLTVTIPQTVIVDGREAMDKLFIPYLDFLNRTVKTSSGKGIKHYVWKIERQKRQQLHFHLVTNEMMDIRQCRKAWNMLLTKHGYMDEWYSKFGNYNCPNATDIKARKGDRMALYLLKELAKKEQNPENLTCKAWGCSAGLEEPYFTVDLNEKHQRKFEQLQKEGRFNTKSGDRWTVGWSQEGTNLPREVLTADQLQEYEIRIQVMGGVIERPKPIVLEEIKEALYIEEQAAPVQRWQSLQINLFDDS